MNKLGERGLPLLEALRSKLADEDLVVRQWSIKCIGDIGPKVIALVPELTCLEGSDDVPIRLQAHFALKKIKENR